MKIVVPALSLVVLVGASGSGKSTFARRAFKPTEVISSDACRGMVGDDETDQSVTPQAFELVHAIARKRLELGRLTVIDATNVRAEDRATLVKLAREHHALPVAIVLAVPPRLCIERNEARPDRRFGPRVVLGQDREIRRGLRDMRREGFTRVHVIDSVEDAAAAEIARVPLWCDRRDEKGPFDVIGDVHGCADELHELLSALGYTSPADGGARRHALGRKAVFLGDLCDRGPSTASVLRTVLDMVDAGSALWVPGNHDVKLGRLLEGKQVRMTHGLEATVADLDRLPAEERAALAKRYLERLDALVAHLVLDGGRLCVAHAGLPERMIGRASGEVREFALYGDATGETDEDGLPVRRDWAAGYRGRTHVVYGHTPTPHAEWVNLTINIDQGCCFGGRLTALRWPERQVVQVTARRVHADAKRAFAIPGTPSAPASDPAAEAPPAGAHAAAQRPGDELIDLADLSGKRVIKTSLERDVRVDAPHAAAALEVLSRFAIDPRLLVYLPPTMSPVETSAREGYLERPEEAFAYFREHGVAEVVCEEKHMGSRCVLLVCRDEAAGRARFGRPVLGAAWSRTGRAFFSETEQRAVLERLSGAIARAGLFDGLESGWVLLDAEVMPWSLKAQSLVRSQYAAVGAAASASLLEAEAALAAAVARGVALGDLLADARERSARAIRYREAYARYCWETQGLEGVAVAPFHLLAAEGRTFFGRDHVWHMETLGALAAHDPLLRATPWRLVPLADEAAARAACDWWDALTAGGGEGFVVKPRSYVARDPQGRVVQPAVKVRGPEYLRIIYGPDYDAPRHLARLRQRGLGRKRGLAGRELALGIEGLERFVRGESLGRVHECVMGVLALESEPVDPRL